MNGEAVGMAVLGVGALYLLSRDRPLQAGGGGTTIIQPPSLPVAAGGDAGGIPQTTIVEGPPINIAFPSFPSFPSFPAAPAPTVIERVIQGVTPPAVSSGDAGVTVPTLPVLEPVIELVPAVETAAETVTAKVTDVVERIFSPFDDPEDGEPLGVVPGRIVGNLFRRVQVPVVADLVPTVEGVAARAQGKAQEVAQDMTQKAHGIVETVKGNLDDLIPDPLGIFYDVVADALKFVSLPVWWSEIHFRGG